MVLRRKGNDKNPYAIIGYMTRNGERTEGMGKQNKPIVIIEAWSRRRGVAEANPASSVVATSLPFNLYHNYV